MVVRDAGGAAGDVWRLAAGHRWPRRQDFGRISSVKRRFARRRTLVRYIGGRKAACRASGPPAGPQSAVRFAREEAAMKLFSIAFAAGALSVAAPALAHHSFAM